MDVSIIIPCLNEAPTIASVIQKCRNSLPEAHIYVFDNNSTDETAKIAAQHGAIVIPSPNPGKGQVIQHAFRVVNSQYYIMIDGDDTYDASICKDLVQYLTKDRCDMVVATRLHNNSEKAFRNGHLFGNHLFSKSVSAIFGKKISDIFSGFRAFNRTFVKSVPLQSNGFELETDLTLQAITLGFEMHEIPAAYKDRPIGSHSKLNTFSDGWRILKFILKITRDHRPLSLFTSMAFACLLLSVLSGWAPIAEYIKFAYVYAVPRAVLAASLGILAAMLFTAGLILDSQRRYHQQQVQLIINFYRQMNSNTMSTASQSPEIFHGAKRFKS